MARRVRPGRSGVAVMIAMGALTAACAAPGTNSPQPQATGTSPVAAAPTCGSAPITMTGYFETGFPLPKALTTEFTKQHPNVTWDIREDQFAVITQNAPRVLAGRTRPT